MQIIFLFSIPENDPDFLVVVFKIYQVLLLDYIVFLKVMLQKLSLYFNFYL